MNTFITGGSGLLGGALRKIPELGNIWAPSRGEFDLLSPPKVYGYDVAFLCAGTKGHAECEGNVDAFRADVDGNIKIIRHLVGQGTFCVFVSTDAVERMPGAYARNRMLVEIAVGGLPNVAIFRPGRFTAETVDRVAAKCAAVGIEKVEGLTRWP